MEPLVRELTEDGPADSQAQTCLKEPTVFRFQKLSQPVLRGVAAEDKRA